MYYNVFKLLLMAVFSQVNGLNVVKVGHRQVVNMIRQGGNSLMVKVVMVARNPELEEMPKRKVSERFYCRFVCGSMNEWHCRQILIWFNSTLSLVPQQSKRLTPPAIALRSKSMTSELEEMGTVLQTHNIHTSNAC